MRTTPMHWAGLALATALAVTAGSAGAAAAPVGKAALPAQHQPNPQARSAGISRLGDAYLGWAQDAGRTAAPRTAASATAAEATATGATATGATATGATATGATATGPTGAGATGATATARHASALAAATRTPGIDVSKWQGNVGWAGQWAAGRRFAFVKATEGTSYTSPYFAQQYNGSYAVGMVRGAYHFALPNSSSGTAQADWFVGHGGGWSADGRTLPGVLDIEYNPYGATCYGLSQSAMRSWIAAFTARYRARTGRDAVIYSTTSWWSTCTGNTRQFSSSNPLWIARYSSTPGTLPAGWAYYTFWQYSDTPIDQDYFNGDTTRLRALALG